MKRVPLTLLIVLAVAGIGAAEETSFQNVKVPTLKGKEIKAVLTFSDNDKAVEVRPAKGVPVTIPYRQIDKCTYEYTEEVTASKEHWLQIDYHDQGGAPQVLLVRMDKKDYLHILDALKAHTGMEAEILGNANKRRGSIWRK